VETRPFWLDEPDPAVAPPRARSRRRCGHRCGHNRLRGGARACPRRFERPRTRFAGDRGGASGRNGGFVLRGGAARYDVARQTYGGDRAAELWRRTEAALDRLQFLAGDAFHRTGSLRLAADDPLLELFAPSRLLQLDTS
jgi:hypothetical protein